MRGERDPVGQLFIIALLTTLLLAAFYLTGGMPVERAQPEFQQEEP